MSDRIPAFLQLTILSFLLTACTGGADAVPDTFDLQLERAVFLDHEGVYNLSGVACGPDGRVYFVDDNGPSPPDWKEHAPVLLMARLSDFVDPGPERVRLERAVPPGVRFDFAGPAVSFGKNHKYDLEGVTVLPGGRIWAVDERDRLLLELEPSSGRVSLVAGPEELLGTWPEFHGSRFNFALEGLTLIGERLFIAWEMHPAAILVYRIKERRLEPGKKIEVENTLDLNGLSSDNGFLYALGRTNSEVYKIDPESGRTLSVARFKTYADSSAYRYANNPEYYNSEGLSVTGKHILVVLDGNMHPIRSSGERAPLLFVFQRPEGF